MSDSLDALPDAKLSEVFAVECAGFIHTEDPDASTESEKPQVWADKLKGRTLISSPYMHRGIGRYAHQWETCTFATSADAVLPFLEKSWYDVVFCGSSTGVHVVAHIGHTAQRSAFAPTFARAACIALIRAARAQKGAE